MFANRQSKTDATFPIDPELAQEAYSRHGQRNLRILLQLYRGKYQLLALSTLLYVIKHSAVWVLPLVSANIINSLTQAEAEVWGQILLNAGILALLILLNVPANYLHTRLRSKAMRAVEASLRGALVRRIQQLSLLYHSEHELGRLQSKIMRDVEAVETLSSQVFVSSLNILINIVVALSVTLGRSRGIFFFFVLTVPVAALSIVSFRRPMKQQNFLFRQEMEQSSAEVMEMVEMLPVTRAHALEVQEERRMAQRLFQIAQKGYRLDLIQSTFGAVSWAVFQIFQVLCLLYSARLALRGQIPVGDILLYQSYFASMVNQVSAIVTLLPTISKGLESVRSIGELLLARDLEDDSGKAELLTFAGNYQFCELHYRYPGAQEEVLGGLNLDVPAGQTVAFVGESGAGKSTLLNLIMGFYLPSSGHILVDGQDLAQIQRRSYRRHLAFVPQTSVLFSGSIRDNICYGLEEVDEARLQEVIRAARLQDLVESLPQGLDTQVGSRGSKLSGGQRQRLAIARALIRDPRVIILDEATSALDSISERPIQSAIEELCRGRSTFIVAHRLSTIRHADQIVLIRDGKVEEQGSWEELLARRGAFYRLYAAQAE